MKLWKLLPTLVFVSCWNPVHADAVDALGDEVAGIPRGPTHRAGQPCTTCHGGDGPGSPEFSMAGTIYASRTSLVAMPGVTVVMVDRGGSTKTAVSNEVGNFYVEADSWSPVYPVHVELQYGSFTKKMDTRIGRNGGCNYCHQGTGDGSHSPAVFLRDVGE